MIQHRTSEDQARINNLIREHHAMARDIDMHVHTIADQGQRIAALEADKALLLRYVRAEERVRATDPLQGTGPYVAAVQERDAACQAILDAGLLEGE